MRGFNKVKKRIVSVLLAFVVMVGCIPFGTEEVKASVAGSSQLSKIEILDFSMYYSVDVSDYCSYDSGSDTLVINLSKYEHDSAICDVMKDVSENCLYMEVYASPSGGQTFSLWNPSPVETVRDNSYVKYGGGYCKVARFRVMDESEGLNSTLHDALGDVQYVEITFPPHSYTIKDTATCTSAGTKTYTCSTELYSISENSPAKGHKASRTKTYSKSAATCTEDAVYYEECSVCHAKLNSEWTDTGSKLGHTYESTPTFDFADNGKSCTAIYQCQICSSTKPVECSISAERKTDPTCTEKGITAYTATAVHPTTGAKTESIKEVADVEMLEHDYTDTVIVPTLNEKGYTQHVCNVCGHEERDTYTDKITVANGTTKFDDDNTLAGTESDGYKILLQEVYLTLIGSDGKEYKTSVYDAGINSTLVDGGNITVHYVTVGADGKETEEVEILNIADLKDGLPIKGDRMYFTFNTSSGETITSQEYHKANKDTGVESITVKGVEAVTTDGEYTCELPCGVDLSSISEDDFAIDGANGTSIVNVTSNSDNKWVLRVGAEDVNYVEDYVVTLVSKEHDYQDTMIVPTCEKDGYTKHVCSVCGDSYEDSKVQATGHKESDWIIDKEATVAEEGRQHKECTVCGKTLAEGIIATVEDTGAGGNAGTGTGSSDAGDNAGTETGSNDAGETETGSSDAGGSAEDTSTGSGNTGETETGNREGTDTSESFIRVGWIYTVGNLKYKVTSKTAGKYAVSVAGLKSKNTKKVSIKKTVSIEGIKCNVIGIADGAFKNAKKLQTVVIADSVRYIGKSTFSGCTALEKVTTGNGITSIGSKAFYGCKKLKTIKISSTKLTKVGKSALKGVNNRVTIKVPAKKMKSYKKLFKPSTGFKKTMKISK